MKEIKAYIKEQLADSSFVQKWVVFMGACGGVLGIGLDIDIG